MARFRDQGHLDGGSNWTSHWGASLRRYLNTTQTYSQTRGLGCRTYDQSWTLRVARGRGHNKQSCILWIVTSIVVCRSAKLELRSEVSNSTDGVWRNTAYISLSHDRLVRGKCRSQVVWVADWLGVGGHQGPSGVPLVATWLGSAVLIGLQCLGS